MMAGVCLAGSDGYLSLSKTYSISSVTLSHRSPLWTASNITKSAQAIMADCEPVFVPLVPPEFNFDANVLEDAFKQGAKAILICNPSNPSGKVFTYDELKLISELCIKYDAFAIMDEVYEHIVYDGHKHIYMNSLPGMWERTVSCSSLSKTYSITGWRLGYAIAPKPIMDRIKQYHDFNTVGAPSPLMEAAVVGLDMPDSYYQEFGAHYAHMKKLFTDGLKQIGIPFTDPQGAYFVLADIGPYMRKGESDVDFCLEMAEKRQSARRTCIRSGRAQSATGTT